VTPANIRSKLVLAQNGTGYAFEYQRDARTTMSDEYRLFPEKIFQHPARRYRWNRQSQCCRKMENWRGAGYRIAVIISPGHQEQMQTTQAKLNGGHLNVQHPDC
jgi:hypothetical protein